MPRKKKAKTAPAPVPRPYTVAKCQWCGMQWKHFGPETPAHFCGKVCEEHERTSRELAEEAKKEEDKPSNDDDEEDPEYCWACECTPCDCDYGEGER